MGTHHLGLPVPEALPLISIQRCRGVSTKTTLQHPKPSESVKIIYPSGPATSELFNCLSGLTTVCRRVIPLVPRLSLLYGGCVSGFKVVLYVFLLLPTISSVEVSSALLALYTVQVNTVSPHESPDGLPESLRGSLFPWPLWIPPTPKFFLELNINKHTTDHTHEIHAYRHSHSPVYLYTHIHIHLCTMSQRMVLVSVIRMRV